MGQIKVTDLITNVDGGSFVVAVQLKDSATGAVIGTSPDSLIVVIPAPTDVPVFTQPTTEVGP